MEAVTESPAAKPVTGCALDFVYQFALETREISGKVDDLLVAFFSAAVKMMQSKVEGVEDENKQLQKQQEGDNENSSKKTIGKMCYRHGRL